MDMTHHYIQSDIHNICTVYTQRTTSNKNGILCENVFRSSLLSYQQPQVSRGYLVGLLMRQPPHVSAQSQVWNAHRISALYPKTQNHDQHSTKLTTNVKRVKRKHDVYLWTPSFTKTTFTFQMKHLNVAFHLIQAHWTQFFTTCHITHPHPNLNYSTLIWWFDVD